MRGSSCPHCGGVVAGGYCEALEESFFACLACGWEPFWDESAGRECSALCDACGEALPEGETGECAKCRATALS